LYLVGYLTLLYQGWTVTQTSDLAYISFTVTSLNIMQQSTHIYDKVYNLIQFIDVVLIASLFIKYK